MKKLGLVFAAFLFGSSVAYGIDTEIRNDATTDQSEQAVVSQEVKSSLTPRRPRDTVIRAQQSPSPAPMADIFIPSQTEAPRLAQAAAPRVETVNFNEPTNNGTDSFVYAELDRLNEEVQKLKKDTAKPDPKKSFSTPRLGGRMFFDAWTLRHPNPASPSTEDYRNKVGLNELRFTVTGTGYEKFDYKAEFALTAVGVASANHIHNDYNGAPSASTTIGQVSLVDAWIGAKDVPLLGYFRAGHYNVETGLATMVGSTNSTLSSPPPSTNSFNLGRKFGCTSEHLFADDKVRWIFGIFQAQNINHTRAAVGDDQGQVFNTRLTMAPYYSDGGRNVLHLGGHYSYINNSTSMNSVSSNVAGNSWLHGAPSIGAVPLSTSGITVEHHNRAGLELAYQRGPFRTVVETFVASFGDQGTAAGTSTEVGYFLTGEHRAYSLSTATFGAPTVKRPFHPFKCGSWNLVDGFGAWQIVARHAYTDLGDWRETTGGYQNDWTLGMNWFWTPNIRCIFEYTHSNERGNEALASSYQDAFGTSIRVNF